MDPVDEVWVERVAPFEEKKFQSVGKGEVELGSEEEKKKAEEERKSKEKNFKDLMGCLKSHLEE
jgi:molecular chaperone HtpG